MLFYIIYKILFILCQYKFYLQQSRRIVRSIVDNEEDDDFEDLEALRLAALRSLGSKVRKQSLCFCAFLSPFQSNAWLLCFVSTCMKQNINMLLSMSKPLWKNQLERWKQH